MSLEIHRPTLPQMLATPQKRAAGGLAGLRTSPRFDPQIDPLDEVETPMSRLAIAMLITPMRRMSGFIHSQRKILLQTPSFGAIWYANLGGGTWPVDVCSFSLSVEMTGP